MTGPVLCDACAHNRDAAKRAGMQGFIICAECVPVYARAVAPPMPPPPPDPWATVREWLNRGSLVKSVVWDGDAFGLGYWTHDGLQQVFAQGPNGRGLVFRTIEELAAWCIENPELRP